MSAKRKDKKGRVLRTGESQRKDLTYQYRYQDVTGKRRTVYAPTLEELRAKEDEINKAQDSGMDLKSLQYLMGHSDAGVTMNVYTHASYDHAEQSMQKILQFQLPEKALKSG